MQLTLFPFTKLLMKLKKKTSSELYHVSKTTVWSCSKKNICLFQLWEFAAELSSVFPTSKIWLRTNQKSTIIVEVSNL